MKRVAAGLVGAFLMMVSAAVSQRASAATTFSEGDVVLASSPVASIDPIAYVSLLAAGQRSPQLVAIFQDYSGPVASDRAGRVYAALSGRIVRLESGHDDVTVYGPVWPPTYPSSMTFDASGAMLVPIGGNRLTKFARNGAIEFEVTLPSGPYPLSLDLASDQCTLLYTTQSETIRRYDVCTRAVRPDLASLPGARLQSLRILPDGSVLAAASSDIVRFSPTGAVFQRYNAPNVRGWSRLALDRGARTFVAAGDRGLYRFNIADGSSTLLTPIVATDVTVVGEPRAGQISSVPLLSSTTLFLTGIAIALAAMLRLAK